MRRAFVMGSNGPENLSPLRYARKDAENIIATLAAPGCGFTVETVQPDADPWEVRRQIFVLAETCTPEDTFVCYFSGHGLLDKGALFLLWDKTERERLLTTAIPI